jgi:hypothetical protein
MPVMRINNDLSTDLCSPMTLSSQRYASKSTLYSVYRCRCIQQACCLHSMCVTFSTGKPGEEKCDYKVEVKTSDIRGAGTDSNVSVSWMGTAITEASRLRLRSKTSGAWLFTCSTSIQGRIWIHLTQAWVVCSSSVLCFPAAGWLQVCVYGTKGDTGVRVLDDSRNK